MSEPFIGQITIFAFNFAPMDYASCDGQLMNIRDNDVLYALLGTTYGGDGINTFGLPDFRGRIPVHQNTDFPLGHKSGNETQTLTINTLPSHSHSVTPSGSKTPATLSSPENAVPSEHPDRNTVFSNTPNAEMKSYLTEFEGRSNPFSQVQPYLTLNFCIALQGIFPSQN